jgi:hypothetical protein
MISVLEDGQVQLREDTVVEEDGAELTRLYHRRVLEPGDDVSKFDNRLRAVCAVVWTADVVARHREAKANRRTP